ncbi:MAG: gamma-glutamyltransferase family protein [Gammaproteobacteria bacterium]|nr:gamma-glutamyltransferase family protein [Gammaproteobacteria bacterium]
MRLSDLPYPSTRMPTFASNGVVATSQPLAAQAGLEVLRAGGNAVDAAIATAVALTVVEPTSNGIGGDLFALIWDKGKLYGLNSSGRAPAAIQAEAIRAQGNQSMPELGWAPVTVPGAPAGWKMMHERFGGLAFDRLFESAISYAADGYPVPAVVGKAWAAAQSRFGGLKGAEFAGWRETFMPGGAAPAVGSKWASPAHAQTLAKIAASGAEAFYRGDLAEAMAAFSAQTGGYLSADDLNAHTSEWVDPIKVDYRGHEVWEIPPNGQGIAALIALGILEGFDASSQPHGAEQLWHWQIEAMKLAFADAHEYVTDPDFSPDVSEQLLSPAHLAARRALIGERAETRQSAELPRGGTVYLCTADRDGMMVSFIQSNYHGFGSGVVVPGTGIALHNRGHAFSLNSNHRNVLEPGKRPFHTIIPGFLTRGDTPIGPFGVMGAPMQPQGHMQVISSTLDHGLNPQAALDAPRWRFLQGNQSVVEPATSPEVYKALIARGHQLVEPAADYHVGRGQIIWQLEDGVYVAGTEPRADGCVAAY